MSDFKGSDFDLESYGETLPHSPGWEEPIVVHESGVQNLEGDWTEDAAVFDPNVRYQEGN